MGARARVVSALVFAGLLTAGAPGAAQDVDVTIRRTSHGIPHITAADYGSLGYGYGYAFAQDNICTIADSYVTVSAQRSRYFGADGTWVFSGNGTVNRNLDSDFFFQRINNGGVVEALASQPPPDGPGPEIRELLRGYVAGYNRYLRDTGVDDLPDPACRGAEWVREITVLDVYRRFYQLALLASSGVAINEIGQAQPPTPPLPTGGRTLADPAVLRQLEDRLAETLGGAGSNAYGFGRDMTSNGRGMVLGNPHFPWFGAERLYQSHLHIPGRLNVAGASLYGVPIVLIGHTENLAWSHTVSTAFRFTPVELRLVPGSPTTYLYDGQPREMERTEVTVEVRTGDGSIEERTRTLYASHHGPIMDGILGLPIFPWAPTTAFAMADANAANFRYLNHFFEKNHAQSVGELYDIQRRNLGIPWVNTIAADRAGDAYYADISVVPHVTDEHAQRCATAPVGQGTWQLLRLPVLDGSRSECEWGTDPDSPQPGTFGPGNLPHLFRTDYVYNGNDSHWLSNAAAPLEGFPRIVGDERAPRTLRTRLGLVMAEEARDGGIDVAGLRALMFNNRQHAGELMRDAVVAMCREQQAFGVPEQACAALEGWDLRDDLDSVGALLFRRFWSHASGATPSPWRDGFDSDDPLHTPRALNTEHPEVRAALHQAVSDLQGAGIPLDAPLGDWQYTERGERIPVHGGPGGAGVFNALNARWDPGEGYSSVPHGASFVMAVQFTDTPCPDGWSLVTYGQSDNPESPYYNDQTRMYSAKEWNRMRFCEDDIEADPGLQVLLLRASEQTPSEPVPAQLPATGGGLLLGVGALLGAALLLRR